MLCTLQPFSIIFMHFPLTANEGCFFSALKSLFAQVPSGNTSTALWKRWERIYFTGFNACYFIPPKSESFIYKDSRWGRLPGFPAIPLSERQLPRYTAIAQDREFRSAL